MSKDNKIEITKSNGQFCIGFCGAGSQTRRILKELSADGHIPSMEEFREGIKRQSKLIEETNEIIKEFRTVYEERYNSVKRNLEQFYSEGFTNEDIEKITKKITSAFIVETISEEHYLNALHELKIIE